MSGTILYIECGYCLGGTVHVLLIAHSSTTVNRKDMARTFSTKKLDIDGSVCDALEAKKTADGYRGSRNAYATEILDGWVKGKIAPVDKVRSQVEAEIYARLSAGRPVGAEFVGLGLNQEKPQGKTSAKHQKRAS